MKKRPPDIFIFMTDQEQAQVVMKDHPCRTPYAQRLAEEGLLFARCCTPAAHSCPARASFFTGVYPSRHGVFNNVLNSAALHGTFEPSLKTFGENLREAGYNLGHTGKWHISNVEDPKDRGWEEVRSTATKRDSHGLSWDQWRKKAKQGLSAEPRKRGEIVMPGYNRLPLYGSLDRELETFRDYEVVASAIQAMERYSKKDDPWCIYCGPVGPHDPYVIPRKYAQMYDPSEIDLPPNYHDDLSDKPRIYQRQRQMLWDQLSEGEVRESIAHYYGYCSLMDDYRGLVYEAIDRLGLRDNTILIFTSDHGDYVGAHGLYCKGLPCFDEAHRVPLVIRWPDGIEAPGRIIDEFVTLCDFAPTFLDVADAQPNPSSGTSLTPFFKSSIVEGWTQEFHTQFNGVEYYYSQRISQTKHHKYVFNPFDFDELYDLDVDPHETKNLAECQAYQEIKLDLVRRMWKFAAKESDYVGSPYFTCALAPWGPMVGFEDD